MSQTKDPAIKLFGRNISVPDTQLQAIRLFKNNCSEITEGETVNLKESTSGEPDKSAVTSQAIRDSQIEGSHSSKPREEQAESSSTTEQEKFKKPDKILPCPRCNSLDTKFCYFNNYNVNQPRHFCKNCQRYWTAGGTMRNVPIGAGRRKNKHLVSQYRQILVSPEGVPIARVENTENSENHQIVSSPEPSNGSRVLKFSSESPLCESMEKTLSLGDQKKTQESESLESVDVPKSANEVNGPVSYCYPVPPPWLFPWAPHNGPNNSAVPIIAVPGFCPPSIPVQLLPASYLNCIPVFPSNGSYVFPSPSSSTSTSCCSGNGSPKLGKHSRDSNLTDDEKGENGIVVPKTLRIDDPNEGSRGPLWGTLVRKNDPKICVSNGSVFKSSETKAEGKSRETEASPILEANPAALSRANTFQESS